MKGKIYTISETDKNQNFALATLYKQKECLQQWLKYLNVKNIYMPEEVMKYRKCIAEISNAIKILEEELIYQSDLSEKNFCNKSHKQARPAIKKNKLMPSTSNSLIDDTKISAKRNLNPVK